MREIRATCGDSKSPSRHNFWVCKKEEFQAFRKICSFITIQNMDEKSREEKMDSLLKVFGHRASIDFFLSNLFIFKRELKAALAFTSLYFLPIFLIFKQFSPIWCNFTRFSFFLAFQNS